MSDLDERIKAILAGHEKLKKRAEGKSMAADDYLRKKEFLSDKINPLLDEKIARLEREKGELVYRLQSLEEVFEAKKMGEAEYNERHVKTQERLAELDGELSALRGGKKDISTLYAPEKPKVVVRRSHAVVAVAACFIFIVFFMTAFLGVDFHLTATIVNFVKTPFERPDTEGLIAGARSLAAGVLGGKENVIGFGFIKPLPGTKVSGKDVEAVFIKPRLKFRIVSAKAYNAESNRECGGDVLVNNVNLTEYGVGIASDDDSFTILFRGCPSMKSEKSDLRRVGMEVSFETSLGEGSSQHTVSGEVDLF